MIEKVSLRSSKFLMPTIALQTSRALARQLMNMICGSTVTATHHQGGHIYQRDLGTQWHIIGRGNIRSHLDGDRVFGLL